MSIFVIWIDHEQAKLFHLSHEKMERSHLRSRHQDHHTHRMTALDQEQNEHPFFSEVVQHFNGDSSKILILGPGVAKHHFLNFLQEHHPGLARKVAGCETVDHPTDLQIAALARKFSKMPVLSSSN